ncbi:hypothetical protein MTO96_048895 [Rhipicephalus appendiculatus]
MGKAGDVLSFLFAWIFVLLDPAAVAIHGLTFTSYALSCVYGTCKPPHVVTALVTVGVIELAAAVNTFSLKASMKLQNILFVIKMANSPGDHLYRHRVVFSGQNQHRLISLRSMARLRR